jgi:hypothetical protein
MSVRSVYRLPLRFTSSGQSNMISQTGAFLGSKLQKLFKI